MYKKFFISLVVLLGTILLVGTSYSQWQEQVSGTTGELVSISAPSNNVAWAAARGGTVLLTLDNGNKWRNVSMSNAVDLWSIYGLNNKIALAIGYTTGWADNALFRTADGGKTWNVVLALPTYHFLDAITFFNDKEGIVYGDPVNGFWDVYKTYDGGITWAAIENPPAQIGNTYGWKNAITTYGNAVYFGTTHFTDNFFFGPDAFVYKSLDRGLTWTYATVPGVVQVNTIQFINSMTGYACGGKTTDGGNTWFHMNDPYGGTINHFILSATAIGSKVWVSGILRDGPDYFNDTWVNSSEIYYSNDGGATWTLDYTAPSGTPNEVRVSRDAMGVKALYIIRTDGGIARKIITGPMAPIAEEKKYELKANYPNPFNPTTTISYQIPNNGLVTLKIYDILGKEVATLVNEVQNAGTFNVQWNASSFSSGTYFYKLTSGNFVETKRMMLIK